MTKNDPASYLTRSKLVALRFAQMAIRRWKGQCGEARARQDLGADGPRPSLPAPMITTCREAFEKAGYWPNEVMWTAWQQAWQGGTAEGFELARGLSTLPSVCNTAICSDLLKHWQERAEKAERCLELCADAHALREGLDK